MQEVSDPVLFVWTLWNKTRSRPAGIKQALARATRRHVQDKMGGRGRSSEHHCLRPVVMAEVLFKDQDQAQLDQTLDGVTHHMALRYVDNKQAYGA